MVEGMTERVTFQVTSRVSNEFARLACELASAYVAIQKMTTQIEILLQGASAPKANPTTNNSNSNNNNNNNNKKGKSAAASPAGDPKKSYARAAVSAPPKIMNLPRSPKRK